MLRGVVKACSLCMLLLQHVVDGYGSGRPSFGMPNSYNMAQSSLQLGQRGKQPNPESSLSSYDQQILADGPPGAGSGASTGLYGPSGSSAYGSASQNPAGYVYPYPTGNQLPATQNSLPPQHVASIYTTTYSSAAAAGEAAAERAVAKMQAKPLPNPFAPLQQMQQQQQHGISSSAHSQGVFASMNSAKPSPPPFSIPPAPPPSLYVKALPLTRRNQGSSDVTSNTLMPSEENKASNLTHDGARAPWDTLPLAHQVSVHLSHASDALNPALSSSVALAKKLARTAAHAKRVRQALAREAARADKAEQAATLGGMYQGVSGGAGGGPPVLSRGMTVIFVTLTIGAIFGVIWFVRKPEPRERTHTDEVFAQSSQQYV